MTIIKSNSSGSSKKDYEFTEKQKFVAKLISDYGLDRIEAVKWCWVFGAFGVETCEEALEKYEMKSNQ